MSRGRGKRLSPDFKARVALEAAKGHKTTSEIAQEYQDRRFPLHEDQQFLESSGTIVSDEPGGVSCASHVSARARSCRS